MLTDNFDYEVEYSYFFYKTLIPIPSITGYLSIRKSLRTDPLLKIQISGMPQNQAFEIIQYDWVFTKSGCGMNSVSVTS